MLKEGIWGIKCYIARNRVIILNNREKYEYWLEAAEYDLESAKVMMNGGRYISGRYPSFKENISRTIDSKRAERVLHTTQEVFSWIESLSQYKA